MRNRRNFIKSASAGTFGLLTLPLHTMARNAKFKLDKLKSGPTDEQYWQSIKEEFKFAQGLKYFNNGSLGPSPLPVRTATEQFRATLDEFPSKYMWGGWNDEKESTRLKVAELMHVDAEEIALIHNTTEGMNLIAKSLDLFAGDEIILADHEHSSGTICWQVWQESKGVKLIRPTLPILPESIDEIVNIYRNAITEKTKVISICHIVNTNGMMLPIKEISKMAHELGILVAVDGAQSAGMLDIDLHDLGCDFYAASSHKWLFSPKGVGILYAQQSSQKYLKPLIVARGHKDESIRRLENYNTRNLPEVLGLGASIDFINSIGIEKITNRSYELKEYFRNKVEKNPKFILKSPPSEKLSVAIQVVEVLDMNVGDVKDQLFTKYGIDCRPMTGFNLNAIRLSFAIYITKRDIDELIEALERIAG